MAVIALLAGTAGTGIGLVRARQETKRAEKVTEYLVKIFRLAEPEQSQGATTTAREILDRQVNEVRESLRDDPGVQGRVMRAMGEAYRGLGLYRTAIPLLEEALPRLEKAYGRDTEIFYDAVNELGNLSNEIGEFAAARRYLESALDVATRLRGPDHVDVATIRRNLGDACVQLGDPAAGRVHLGAALALQIRLSGAQGKAVAKTLGSLSALEIKAGQPEVAVGLAERSLTIRLKSYGPADPAVGFGWFALGEAHLASGRFELARTDFEAALPIFESACGKEHAKVGECLLELAKARAGLGQRDEAYRLYQRARAIAEKAFGPSDPRLAGTLAGWLDAHATVVAVDLLPDSGAHKLSGLEVRGTTGDGVRAGTGTAIELLSSRLTGLSGTGLTVGGSASAVNLLVAQAETGIALGSSASLDLVHGTIADCGGPGVEFAGQATVTFSLFWNNGGGDLPGVDCRNVTGSLVCDPACAAFDDNFCGDPLFIGGGDYHVQSSSPALERAPVPNGSPCRDLDGGPRGRDFDGDGIARRDVGAFEQVNPSLVPGVIQTVRFAARNRLEWDPPAPPDPARYHVYRDSTRNLSYANFGACVDHLDPDPTDTVFQDDETPAHGVAWAYLVTAESTAGREGSMGLATCTERSNFTPCP